MHQVWALGPTIVVRQCINELLVLGTLFATITGQYCRLLGKNRQNPCPSSPSASGGRVSAQAAAATPATAAALSALRPAIVVMFPGEPCRTHISMTIRSAYFPAATRNRSVRRPLDSCAAAQGYALWTIRTIVVGPINIKQVI
eukprot:COSAG02_NODE_8406_length_2583_cov_2.654589_1_plen_143_part_00